MPSLEEQTMNYRVRSDASGGGARSEVRDINIGAQLTGDFMKG
jgi:hypothetical protein